MEFRFLGVISNGICAVVDDWFMDCASLASGSWHVKTFPIADVAVLADEVVYESDDLDAIFLNFGIDT